MFDWDSHTRPTWPGTRHMLAAAVASFVLLILLCGPASAKVQSVVISEPTTSAPVYALPGSVVVVKGEVTASACETIDLRVTVGATTVTLDNAVVGTGLSTPVPFAVSVVLSPVDTAGALNVQVKATGDSSKVANQSSCVLVDSTPPTGPSTISVSPANLGNVRPTWSWTAYADPSIGRAAAGSGVARCTVRYRTNGGSWSAPVSLPADAVSWTPDFDMADGTWEVQVAAFDRLGNASQPVTGGAYVFDTVAPDAPQGFTITPPSPGTDTTPTWAWSPSADNPGGAGLDGDNPYVVELSADGGNTWAQLPGTGLSGTSWTPASALADIHPNNRYVIRVSAVDKAGNRSPASVPSEEYWLDAAGPAFSAAWPSTGFETRRTDLALSVNVTDGEGVGVNADSLVWAVTSPNGDVAGTVFWDGAVCTFRPDEALSPGVYSMRVAAEDRLGNRSVSSSSEDWGLLVDTTGPELEYIGLAADCREHAVAKHEFTAERTPTLTAVVTDKRSVSTEPSGFNASGTVELSVFSDAALTAAVAGKTLMDPKPRLNSDSWRASWTPLSPLEDGDYCARVRATDDAGNTAEFCDFVFTVDTTGPVTTSVKAPPGLTNKSRPEWEWSAADSSGADTDHFIVTLDDEPPVQTTSTTFTPAADLPAGRHVLRVTAVDSLGNIGPELVFPEVTVVNAVVTRIDPPAGTYRINQMSTIAVTLSGLIDADLEVAVGGNQLAPRRIVELTRTPALSKFYLLLDGAVVAPGQVVLTLRAGTTETRHVYELLNERSGFGFGRLQLR